MGATRTPVFWNRDTDSEGRSIRLDVRCAAQQFFEKASRMTEHAFGDASDTAEILESCVSLLSRYLDKHHHELFSQRTAALLFVSFRRALYSRVKGSRRLIAIGDMDALADHRLDFTWGDTIEDEIDMVKLVARLSKTSRAILRLRRAGYDWREVAALMGVSIPKAKSTFWRELHHLSAHASAEQPGRCMIGRRTEKSIRTVVRIPN